MSLKPSAFLETIITFLLPYFTVAAVDINEARTEILETLVSYATRTRAEMLQAAQIIALGMTTLDVLAEAKTAEMSQSMRIRFRGCANGLNRSALQTEKALDQRLACDLPMAPEPLLEPINDVPDAELRDAILHAQAKIDLHLNRLSGARPTGAHPTTREERNQQLSAGAMMDALTQMGIPVPAASGG